MMSGMVQEQNLEKQIEKQMGCMAGFLQLFDHHHILTGKRLYSTTKRLPPSTDKSAATSLDSRATTDANGSMHPREIRTNASILSPANAVNGATDGQQHQSPSVIARLMGLETLSNSSNPEPENKAELRRSNSESRVSRDLFHSRFQTNGKKFHSKRLNQSHYNVQENVVFETPHHADPMPM